MTRYTLRCLSRAMWRLLFALVLLAALTELALLVVEDSGGSRLVFRVALEWAADEMPAALAGSNDEDSVPWWQATLRAALQSGKVFVLLLAFTLGFGVPLGILTARWRRWVLLDVLISPLFLLAAWPGFWIACVLIWWQIDTLGWTGFSSNRPGVGRWWDAFLIASIVAPPAVTWQIRSIAWAIRDRAGEGHVWGALSRGQAGSRLFYLHVFSSAFDPVCRSLDRVLPALVGGQLLVEWVFRYPGLGTLMIESARNGYHPGMLAGGFMMTMIVVGFRFAGEIIYGACDRRGRENFATSAA